MKRVIILMGLAMAMMSCASSTRLFRQGNYDAAIERSVRRLHKNPQNEKEILVLERAYNIANELDLERIRFLERDPNPRSTVEKLEHYTRMKNRQSLVRTVTPLQLPARTVSFPYIDYDERIIEARSGAAEFHYQQAMRLFENNDKESYRLAWSELVRVIEYAGNDYQNADRYAREARERGISRVLVTANNHTHLNLPPEFVDQLLTVDTRRLDNMWVEFYYRDLDPEMYFDYFINIHLKAIVISPDQVSEKDRMVRKRVEDGFEYLLDSRGNVRKDSLGNDIRVPKFKDLACTVIETHQRKSVSIEGDMEILSEQPRRLLKREPLGAVALFEHFSARAVGDLDALDEETLELVGVKRVDFPSEPEMIMLAAESMRRGIADALARNRRLIR